jgi:glutathione reductase (NADPH)
MGLASLTDGNTVAVQVTPTAPTEGDAEETRSIRSITGAHILVACGGEPSVLNIPGADSPGVITSDGFFDLPEQPKKVAVIGAGYIAVEMAGILHGLGTETHLFFRGETVLRRGFDPFIVDTLMEALTLHGPTLHPTSSPTNITPTEGGGGGGGGGGGRGGGGLTLVTESTDKGRLEGKLEVGTVGESFDGFDCILMAIGRHPVTDLLTLDNAGVTVNKKGFIEVNEYVDKKGGGRQMA